MTAPSPSLAFGPEFDSFLFEPIGWDNNEMALSVLSALARLDIDPWQEAAGLARLPKEAAATRLASLIAALPGGLPKQLDLSSITRRLVGLLPSSTAPPRRSPQTPPELGGRTLPRVLFVLLLVFAMGTQYFAASRQASAPADVASPISDPSVSVPLLGQ